MRAGWRGVPFKTFMPKKILPLLSILAASSPLLAKAAPPIVPVMVTIHGGEFAMGSTADPKNDDYPTSEPVHPVHVKPFRLSRYETTVGQFRQFVEATGYNMEGDCWKLAAGSMGMGIGKEGWNAPANAPSEFHPVMCVSYDDAHAYLRWLSEQTGRHFRLPSEAEWEYAARAGSSARYTFGDDPSALCRFANVFDKDGKAAISPVTGQSRSEVACEDHAGRTSVVGLYEPNAFGLFDMLGNVGELVEDCQHLSYQGAPDDGSAWTSGCDLFHGSKMAIYRGGSFNSGAVAVRPTYRGHAGTKNRSAVAEGFRIAEDASGEAAPDPRGFAAELAKAQVEARAAWTK